MTNITLCAHHRGGGGGGSFNVSIVKLRNGLPDEIKRKNILLSFKNALKSYCKYQFYLIVDNYFNF